MSFQRSIHTYVFSKQAVQTFKKLLLMGADWDYEQTAHKAMR